MVNINLTAGPPHEEIEEKTNSQKELLVLLAIVLILFLAYGGLYYYNKGLKNESLRASEERETKTSAFLASEETKNFFDFQNRLNIANGLFVKKNKNLGILDELEKIIIPGIYISTYDYDDEAKTLKLELVCDEYNNVAKQVLSLKKSNYFSEIILSESRIDEKGDIRMPIELRLVAESVK
jgi:hypothetical protein